MTKTSLFRLTRANASLSNATCMWKNAYIDLGFSLNFPGTPLPDREQNLLEGGTSSVNGRSYLLPLFGRRIVEF